MTAAPVAWSAVVCAHVDETFTFSADGLIQHIRADLAGMAAGIGSTMRYLGGIIGVAVLSLLLDVHGTRADVVSEHGDLVAGDLCP